MRALESRGLSATGRWPDGLRGWEAPDWLASREYDYLGAERPPVPLRPIPLGLAADAIFYGGVLFALYAAAGSGRSALRRWRGLCPSCGYSLAGLAEGGACPECGSEPNVR